MTAMDDARYRLRLAKGFLKEAQQDLELQRWRSCVDNAQLAIENSGKTILAVFGPTPHTHEPTKDIQKLIDQQKIDESLLDDLKLILPFFDQFGFEEHFKTDYGLESEYIVPWDLFEEDDAQKAVQAAEQCLELAEKTFGFYFPEQ
ncbi:MAG TPA: HEPN domain-containing protein [bacterium]